MMCVVLQGVACFNARAGTFNSTEQAAQLRMPELQVFSCSCSLALSVSLLTLSLQFTQFNSETGKPLQRFVEASTFTWIDTSSHDMAGQS